MANTCLMDIWKGGAKMPFIVESPSHDYRVVIMRYNWVNEFFEGFFMDHEVELSAYWQEWNFVREA